MQIQQQLKDDFRYFLTAVWTHLALPAPTRAQLCIAEYLQNGPKRLQIQAFRGVGKSWITAAFVLWTLYNNSDKKIMVVSASKDRADSFSIFCQRLILEVPWMSHLKPKNDDQRWSRVSFDVGPAAPHQAPSVKSVGITGQLTGSRADLMVLDDVEVPNNSMTELQREKLLQLVTECESILTPKKDSRIMFLGTPQTTFTVYNKLRERAYKPFVWPARYPRKVAMYDGLLAPQLEKDLNNDSELTWVPTDTRFREEDLLERESAMGRSNFMLQFMLDTSLSDAEKFPLKFADLIINPVNPETAPENIIWCSSKDNILKDLPCVGLPGDYYYSPMQVQGEWKPYSETICSVDPSGRGSDETVACFISQLNGIMYLHEVYASTDGYSDKTLLSILARCKKYKVSTLLIESNFGDGMVSELFRKHAINKNVPINIEETRANVRKEDRIIDSLEPVFNQHRLVVDPRVIKWDFDSGSERPSESRFQYMLGYQISRMCREKGAVKHDDRIDALAQGVKWFTDALAISASAAIKDRKDQEWLDHLEAWMDDPQAEANHLVLGMNHMQRKEARGKTKGKPLPTWV
ncbi:DNA maturase beta subunit [Prochlorococcus phage P-SSP6]|uniref:Terminase, large subunit n=2 Tax=Tangaroavirus tv951510a TaxID=2733962 RepID=M1PKU6_9CAUD|nr:terminase large subunit [Cyanophage 9515-10a]ADP00039.1 DNA maturase beta subunit [Cyanophage 9515-10a]AGF91570.1 DNA maturase beta subunit [Prochlorococcus phage P-SSP6]